VKLDALLRAHGFTKVERPPELWEADTDDARFIPLLGEIIAAILSRGATLEETVLRANNMEIPLWDDEPEDAERPQEPAPGEYVAITVLGRASGEPQGTWLPGPRSQAPLLNRLHERLETAGAAWAYVRSIPPESSITVLLRRSGAAGTETDAGP
jgi:hypothetical protein